MSFEDVEHFAYYALCRCVLVVKSTSDQCDESDLLKFVQNQIRAKLWT